MNESMCRVQRGSFVYYTCRRIPVRHAFTTKFGGVSTGACASLNLGFNRGDELENVRENYRLLGEALGVDETRMTLTKQIHDTQVSVVTEDKVGMGLHRPMEWQSDAIVTALPDTPIIGFYADCVVTLLYDPATHTAGVCHSGWRGMAAGIRSAPSEIALLRCSVRPSGRSASRPMRMCRKRWKSCSVHRCIRSSWRKVRNSMWTCRALA